MKANINNITEFILEKKIHGLFLYGTDQNVKNFIIQGIKKLFSSVNVYEYSDVSNPDSLLSIFQSNNLFLDQELIIIKNIKEINIKILPIFNNIKYLNFPLLVADESYYNQHIISTFNNAKYCGVISCYPEHPTTIKAFCKHLFETHDKNISDATLNFMISYVPNRLLAISEVNKILSIMSSHQKTIEIHDIKLLISKSSPQEDIVNELCTSFVDKSQKYFELLEYIDEISAIRALSQYYSNLYIVKMLTLEDGYHIDDAIVILKQKIFSSHVTNFKANITKLSIDQIIRTLKQLIIAEVTSKSNACTTYNSMSVFLNTKL